MNGFELCEKILAIDINVKVCFMSNGEINREALREIYPAISIGCFIRKPVTIDYLLLVYLLWIFDIFCCLKRRFSKDLESTQVDIDNLMSVFLHSLALVVLMTCSSRMCPQCS